MKFPQLKNVGFHRGKPRLYFQSPHLHSIGFEPGSRYDLEPSQDGKALVIRKNPEGKRAVCKKVIGAKVFSIIDINTDVLDFLKHEARVEVGYTMHSITIELVSYERAAELIAKGLA